MRVVVTRFANSRHMPGAAIMPISRALPPQVQPAMRSRSPDRSLRENHPPLASKVPSPFARSVYVEFLVRMMQDV